MRGLGSVPPQGKRKKENKKEKKKNEKKRKKRKKGTMNNIIIIIIMNFYSPVSNTRCHSIGHKMRIARIKIRVDSQGRWERA